MTETTIADSDTTAARIADRARQFRELHERPGAFVIPNPWDAGTARLFELLGFEALATTGAGFAFASGRADGCTDPAALLDHVAALAAATDLPLSADLEDGFGAAPESVAATITTVGGSGVVGGSIEDRHYRDDAVGQLFDIGHASERIRAAADAARSLPFPFTLTARCECSLVGRADVTETIRRLQAYQDAGAHVLYAPGVISVDDIRAITSSVDRPVNVVMGLVPAAYSVAELAALGVRRVSLGSTLSRVALGAVVRAAEELRSTGTFSFVEDAIAYGRINSMFASATT